MSIASKILTGIGRVTAFNLLFKVFKVRSNWPTLIFLLLINILPLFGVIFFGWKAYDLLIYFWLENVIAGIFYFLKLIFSGKGQTKFATKLIEGFGFLFTYGFMNFVHGVFALVFYLMMYSSENADITKPDRSPLVDGDFVLLFNKIVIFVAIIFILETINFLAFFIFNKQYKETAASEFQMVPFNRSIILHLVLVFGFIPLIPFLYILNATNLLEIDFLTNIVLISLHFAFSAFLLGIKSLWELQIYFYADRMGPYTTKAEKHAAIYRRAMWEKK